MAAGQPDFQGGPYLPFTAVRNISTGKNVDKILFGQPTLSGGIIVVKLSPDNSFNDTNYGVVVTEILASDTLASPEEYSVNPISGSEFHIVSSNGSSTAKVAFIAIGQ